MARIPRRIGSFLYWRYHRLRSSWPVWYYVLNRQPRRWWRSLDVRLDERKKSIVRALEADGIAVIPITDLLPFSLFDELMREASDRARRAAGGDLGLSSADGRIKLGGGAFSASTKKYQKDFLADLWGEGDTPTLDVASPFTRLALDPRVLAIVGAYLGMAPRFFHFSLLSTVIRPAGTPEEYSQRWHRDSEDRKMVKVFLYLTDVGELGAGPFTYIRGSKRGGRFGHLWPQHPPVGSYPPPGAVERAVPPSNILECFGKAGTLIFCDTTGLHRGGYSTTKERVMFTASYCTKASIHPRLFQRPPALPADISPLARYALAD